MQNKRSLSARGCAAFLAFAAGFAVFFAACELGASRLPTFTVTFNAGGGTGALPARKSVEVGASITIPGGNGLSRSGHVFAGWNTAANGTGENLDEGDRFVPTGDLTLYARWVVVFTVTFDANGGEGTPPAVITGIEITIPTGDDLSKDGFAFGGWNTQADGGGTGLDAGATFTLEGDITLFANWVRAVTIRFDVNDGHGTMLDPQIVSIGDKITLPGGYGLSKGDFVFAGWNTNADGTGDNFDAGEEYGPTRNVTLFAIWTATVTFHINEGAGTVPEARTLNAGSNTQLPGGGGFSRDGFTFGGWNTRADGAGDNFAGDSTFTPSGNVTLYVRWLTAFTVSFSRNGGTGTEPDPRTVIEGTNITLPSGDGLSRSGFAFGGWNTGADGSGDNFDAGSTFTPTGNVTLYARWVATVTFDANGGTGALDPRLVNAGSGTTLPDGTGLSRGDFVFAGWNTNAAGTGDNFAALHEFVPAGNITLFARWTATVTFHVNEGEGTVPEARTLNAGSNTQLPSGGGLSRGGFIFGGWNTRADGAGDNFAGDSTITPSGNVTLYVRWLAAFTVTFSRNGGTGTEPDPRTTIEGTNITLPSGDGLSRSGYTFAGWNTRADGSGGNFDANDEYMPTGSITLYARWLAFTVSFNANGGTGTAASQRVAAGSSVTLSDGGGLSRGSFVFAGWNTRADGGGTNLAAGSEYTPVGDITLYARWMATVTFDANSGTGTVPPITTNAGAGISLPTSAALSKSGFIFAGWNTNAGGTGTNLNAGDTYVPPGNITLYARWTVAFTVTFDMNGGTGTTPAQRVVGTGSSITLPGDTFFSRSGFAFSGWNTGTDGSGYNFDAGGTFTPTGNVTLHARWVATVTFDANGGTGAPTPRPVNAGSGTTLPDGTGLSRGDFVFAGWNTNVAGTGDNFAALHEFVPAGSITLFARWTATVTFNINEGAGAVPEARTLNAGSNTQLPGGGGLSRGGFIFGGWNTRADGAGDNFAGDSIITPSGNVTLYVRWLAAFTVTFSRNGGTGTEPNPRTAIEGTNITLPSGDGLSRSGYTFAGWNTRADGSGDNLAANDEYMPAGSITLYARWLAFTVSFNANGGTGTAASQRVAAGSSVTLSDGGGLSRGSFVFAGWNTRADGGGTNLAAGSEHTPTGDITLYARWMATVTFDANSGTGTVPPITTNAGADISLPTSAALSKSGFIFAGWNTNAGGTGTDLNAGDTYVPPGNITLYARWTVAFTVTFDMNGATGTAPAQRVVGAGSGITLPGDTFFSRSGFAFGGWNTGADGSGDNFDAGGTFTPTGNVTLHARWVATVTFDANGGTGAPDPRLVNAGSSTTLPDGTGLSRGDFVFAGWNTNAAGTGDNFAALHEFVPAGNITLFARWTATVTFNINEGAGTVPEAITLNAGSNTQLPGGGGFSRDGFTFGGWNTRADGMGDNFAGDSTFTPSGNVTLYVRWLAAFTVTFNPNDGGGAGPVARTTIEGSHITIPGREGLARTGHSFGGWNTRADGAGDNFAEGDTFTPPGNVTLFAVWLVSWNAGANSATDTTAINLNFAVPVSLTPGNITVAAGTGTVTVGALDGGGNSWTLAVTVTSLGAGEVYVSINAPGIESGPVTVPVVRPPVGWTASAYGAANTTAIVFEFDEPVIGLVAGDITVAAGTGAITAGALTGEGTTWRLAVAVARAGEVAVSIARPGIVNRTETLGVSAITWTATAVGRPTTAIRLDFSQSVWLTPGDIRVVQGTGAVTVGALTGGGTSWTLAASATRAGGVWISVNSPGVESGAKIVIASSSVVVSAGGGSTVAIRNGELWAWGDNRQGQLGDGTTTQRSSPVRIGSETDWVYVSVGSNFAMGIRADGSLWAWGNNGQGRLGDGTTTGHRVPIQVGTETNWATVAAGSNFTIATRTDGSLWAWGANGSGQLGDGTTTQHTRPTQIGTETAWALVSAGSAYTMAIRADGSLWAWGSNGSGQLGDGSTIQRTAPVRVGFETNWTSVTTGASHTIAIRADGSLWAWGNNIWGELGDGTTTHRTSPIQIGTETDWATVDASNAFTVAVRTDGTAWAWGGNREGQLGGGSWNGSVNSTPRQVGTATNWTAVTTGSLFFENVQRVHVMGIRADGTLWGWGSNGLGQIGDGGRAARFSPVQIIIP